ncbi:unnamed protein product, partial [Sphacelaria rigidula]
FGLGKRCLSDGRLNSLIDDHGVSKPVMNYCRELKPLHLVHDMISTFCNGKHVDSGSDDYLEKINKDLRVRLEIAQDGNDAVRNSTDELELAILQYKERQYEFATASKTWITDKGSRDAIHRCTYADIDPNPSGGGNGAAAGIFDQMDAAYHRVFKGVLNG